VPTEREQGEWYFQRYIAHLPTAGEIVLFDRSWYNRAGVEKVMGFCTPEEHRNFLRDCPIFERLLIDDGILLTKYWFSVSDEEQEKRFKSRLGDPLRRWKLSPMDLESRNRWVAYSRAKDEMMSTPTRPSRRGSSWRATTNARARLNCIAHLLTRVPYEADRGPGVIHLPPRGPDEGYVRPDLSTQHHVPDFSATLLDEV
jgi:polyphosphate kinase 2 (PPK2 family)